MNQDVQENELHAYADGQLPEAQRARVESWLLAHPEDAERVKGWHAQNALLRDCFNAVVDELSLIHI